MKDLFLKKVFFSNFLRNTRHKVVLPYLKGKVLDFGGGDAVFKKYLDANNYVCINSTKLEQKYEIKGKFDIILVLAVLGYIKDPIP